MRGILRLGVGQAKILMLINRVSRQLAINKIHDNSTKNRTQMIMINTDNP